MPIDKSSELYNTLLYLLSGVASLLLIMIGVIYNLTWKSIKDLFLAKKEIERKVNQNSEDISATKARCEERTRKN